METIMKPTPTLLTTFILAPFAALLCSGASAVSADFVLVDAAARIPPAPIIIPKEAPASIREATQALSDYVRQICGTKPGIVERSPTPLPDRAIWVGLHPELPRLKNSWGQVNYLKFALAKKCSQGQCSWELFPEHHETSAH
jgi:hypothetical protein